MEFPLPFGRVMSAAEKAVYAMDEKVIKFVLLSTAQRVHVLQPGNVGSSFSL